MKIKKELVSKLRVTILESVYVTIGNPAFCLFIYLTGVNFRGELRQGGDVNKQKIKCQPIRTREIGGVSLPDALYVLQVRLLHEMRDANFSFLSKDKK